MFNDASLLLPVHGVSENRWMRGSVELLTKLRMGMSHRGPPRYLMLFEYDTNPEWHDLTVQKFLCLVVSVRTIDKISAHLRKCDIFLQPIEMSCYLSSNHMMPHVMILWSCTASWVIRVKDELETNFIAAFLLWQIWNVGKGRVFCQIQGWKMNWWKDVTSVGYAISLNASICWL